MFPFLRSKQTTLVGLEIHSDEVRLLQLNKTDNVFSVKTQAVAPLPAVAIVDGNIKQPDVVQKQLTELVQQTQTQGLPTALALPVNSVISQRIKLPSSLQQQECEAEISLNLERYLPGINEDLCFDYVILATNHEHHDILLVVSRSEQVNTYQAVATQAGLQVKIMDVDIYAASRAQQIHLPLAPRFLVCCGLAMRKVPTW